LRYGAFINCVVHADRAAARAGVRGSVATFARFSSFKGSQLERLPPPPQSAARHLREKYDMREHTPASAAHSAGLDDDFIDWFGIAGPVETALPRFQELAALGLDFCRVIPGSSDMPREVAASSIVSLAQQIVPALRNWRFFATMRRSQPGGVSVHRIACLAQAAHSRRRPTK
jgi:hypothetical protein